MVKIKTDDLYFEAYENIRQMVGNPAVMPDKDIIQRLWRQYFTGKFMLCAVCSFDKSWIQGTVIRDTAVQGRAIQGRAIQGRAIQERAIQGRAVQGRAVQGRAIQGRAVQGRTIQGRAIQGRAVQGTGILCTASRDAAGDSTVGIDCPVLAKLDSEEILGGCLYIVHAPEAAAATSNLLEQFYIESWQTALLNVFCIYMRKEQESDIQKKYSSAWVSPAFGPGSYGMGIETLPGFFQYLHAESAGVTLCPTGSMRPEKSLAGMYLYMKKQWPLPEADCIHCAGNPAGCMWCRAGIDKQKRGL